MFWFLSQQRKLYAKRIVNREHYKRSENYNEPLGEALTEAVLQGLREVVVNEGLVVADY